MWLLGFLSPALWLGLATAALQAVAGIVAAVGPAVGVVLGALAQAVVWLWQAILWPGLRDILDSWATIATVLFAAGGLYLGIVAASEVRAIKTERALETCKADLAKAKRKPSSIPQPTWDLPWPFRW